MGNIEIEDIGRILMRKLKLNDDKTVNQIKNDFYYDVYVDLIYEPTFCDLNSAIKTTY